MRFSLFALPLLLLVSVCVSGQEGTRFVRIPAEIVPVLVLQQDCPLKVEKAEFLLLANGSGKIISYQIKNHSLQSIKRFVISSINIEGGGSGWTVTLDDQQLLKPGEVLSSLANTAYKVVPFSEKLTRVSTQSPRPKAVWVVIVEEVVFADGSRYEAKHLVESITAFLDR